MVGDEKGDQHAGHQADAAEGSEGDGETPGQGPSCAPNRSTHIFMIGTVGPPRLSAGVAAGGRGCHHGATVPSQEKNWPVGPSSGSIASQTAPAAASPGSPPLAAARAFRFVARSPGARALTLNPSAASACA